MSAKLDPRGEELREHSDIRWPWYVPAWSRGAKGWGVLGALVVLVVAFALLPILADRLDTGVRISPAGVRVADAFVNALLVKEDCPAALRLVDPGQLPDNGYLFPSGCKRGVQPVLVTGYTVAGTVPLPWREPGAPVIVPHCRFKGRYAVYGPGYGSWGKDDCAAFITVVRLRGALQRGSLAVTVYKVHGRWVVTDYEFNWWQTCDANCEKLWQQRARRASAT